MRVYVSSPKGEFEAVVAVDAELAGRFDAIDVETGEQYDVEGWACDIDELEDPADMAPIEVELPAELIAWNGMSDAQRAQVVARIGESETVQLSIRACLAEIKAGRHADT